MACVDMENISMAMSGVVVLGRWEMGSNQGTVDGLRGHLYILERWKCWLENWEEQNLVGDVWKG